MHVGLIALICYVITALVLFGVAFFDVRGIWERTEKTTPSTADIISELQIVSVAIRQGRIKAGADRLDELIQKLSRTAIREAA